MSGRKSIGFQVSDAADRQAELTTSRLEECELHNRVGVLQIFAAVMGDIE
jgi:hypothetical protein